MSFAVRLFAKTAASNFLAKLLAPAVDQALPSAEPEKAKVEEKDPLTGPDGVITAPKHFELSSEQIDHVLNRIHFDAKHRGLAEEIKVMRDATKAARPYTVG